MKLTKKVGNWALGVLIAADIVGAALIGAKHGETISHYAGRNADTWGKPICAVLDVFDKDHCVKVTY
jgi:hypothetical protein